jgi:hypothetical protein
MYVILLKYIHDIHYNHPARWKNDYVDGQIRFESS